MQACAHTQKACNKSPNNMHSESHSHALTRKHACMSPHALNTHARTRRHTHAHALTQHLGVELVPYKVHDRRRPQGVASQLAHGPKHPRGCQAGQTLHHNCGHWVGVLHFLATGSTHSDDRERTGVRRSHDAHENRDTAGPRYAHNGFGYFVIRGCAVCRLQ
jgi:hypothetical protein